MPSSLVVASTMSSSSVFRIIMLPEQKEVRQDIKRLYFGASKYSTVLLHMVYASLILFSVLT